MKHIELLQELNDGAFTEWVIDTGLEGHGWRDSLQILHPLLSDGSRHQVTLVENKDEMLRWAVPFQMLLEGSSSRSIGVSSIQDIDENVRTIDDLVKLFPNSLRKSLLENSVSDLVLGLNEVILMQISIFLRFIEAVLLVDVAHKFVEPGKLDGRALSAGFGTEGVIEA